MLRTNLSTQPFYNERGTRVLIGVAVLLTAALSAFLVAQVFSLRSRNSELAQQMEQAEARAADLRRQAQMVRQSLNKANLAAVQQAAEEANQLIDRRAFSWTDLFNRFEETLPADVRIVAVTPQLDEDGRMLVATTVIARSPESQDEFIDALEATGAFRDVIARTGREQDDRTLLVVLQGYYNPAAVSVARASDTSTDGGNATPAAPANATAPSPSRVP